MKRIQQISTTEKIVRELTAVWSNVRVLILSVSFFLVASAPPPQPSPEYQVKAAFLFNFAQFVEWPPQAFVNDAAPLVIGILGEDPFGGFLDETVKGEKANGRVLVVRRFKDIAQVETCHILFAADDHPEKLEPLFALAEKKHILTVGDASKFARSGGMIRFFIQDNKIRFGINVDAAKAADLTISSKLLRLAELVGKEER